jgi:hypothetical protein
MDEADASSTPSPENGQPVQTSTEDATSADIDNNDKTLLKLPQDAEPLSSLLGQRVMGYLATADNEVLLAFLGAFALLTYFILGRLGLVLIGMVSGFLLREYLADHGAHHGQDRDILLSRRKELGIEVATRLLDWPSQKAAIESDHDIEVAQINDAALSVDISQYSPATATALSELIDAIVKDYVK